LGGAKSRMQQAGVAENGMGRGRLTTYVSRLRNGAKHVRHMPLFGGRFEITS
jgi:hypothetical protein